MRTLAETLALLHRGLPPMAGLPPEDVLRILRHGEEVLGDLDRLHARGDLHGDVCPRAVLIRRGARLAPPGRVTASREFRDPVRERTRVREGTPFPIADPGADLYGLGATLFAALEGGAPPCGAVSRFTRPVPPAAAYVVARAMRDGAARYPTARAMRDDLRRLRRLAKGRGLDAVRPEDLPSWSGARVGAPRPLVPFEVREKTRRRRGVGVWLLLAALLAAGVFSWSARERGTERTAAAAAARTVERAAPERLPGLLASWRARLDDRLRAAGEKFDPLSVPLVVVAEAPVPRRLGWTIHPSARLTRAVRAVLTDDLDPAAVQRVLLEQVGADTLPAVLWVTRGPKPGTVRARLVYRGIVLDEVVRG